MRSSGGVHFVGTRWMSATPLPISEWFITPSEDEAAGVQQSCSRRAAGKGRWRRGSGEAFLKLTVPPPLPP